MYISGAIKHLRQAKNLTQNDLAELLQVTKSTISAYETDARVPSIDVLIKMAKIFHVSIDYLVGNNNKCSIDVTGLTDKQRNNIQDMIKTYRLNNNMIEYFKLDELKINALLEKDHLNR